MNAYRTAIITHTLMMTYVAQHNAGSLSFLCNHSPGLHVKSFAFQGPNFPRKAQTQTPSQSWNSAITQLIAKLDFEFTLNCIFLIRKEGSGRKN